MRSLKRKRLTATILLVVAVIGLYIASSTHHVVAPNRSILGVYAGTSNSLLVKSVNAQLGGAVGFGMTFSEGSTWKSIVEGAKGQCHFARDARVQLVAPYNMLPNSGSSLALGAQGNYDRYAYSFAQSLIQAGCADSVVRIGWEFNGDWFPWAVGGQSKDFVAYWRDIIEAMRSVPGEKFTFLWNPTVAYDEKVVLPNDYPGDSFVDVVGLDVYDASIGAFPGQKRNWKLILDATYGLNWLAHFSELHGKKIAIPEWGLGSGTNGGGDDSYFVSKMIQWISGHNVLFATLWDYGTSPLPSSTTPKSTRVLVDKYGH